MTYAIDQHACVHFIRASASTPSVTKFLLVSAMLSRVNRAPWWDDESWETVHKTNTEKMPDYHKAKVASDKALVKLGGERKGWGWISLRPAALSNGEETGKVTMGKTQYTGDVTRADVADVAVRLLEKEGISGWFDLIGGGEDTAKEVERVVSEGVDTREGEDLDNIKESDFA
jgi:nucleoside-diphosphate-sugar epimerase